MNSTSSPLFVRSGVPTGSTAPPPPSPLRTLPSPPPPEPLLASRLSTMIATTIRSAPPPPTDAGIGIPPPPMPSPPMRPPTDPWLRRSSMLPVWPRLQRIAG